MSYYRELPAGTNIPSLQHGQVEDTPIIEYPRLLKLTNGFTAPDNGLVIIQVIGTGSVLSVQIDNIPYTFNAGVALVSGSLYEFDVHVRQGEQIYVDPTTCVIRALFFRRGE